MSPLFVENDLRNNHRSISFYLQNSHSIMEIQESQKVSINDRALTMNFADGITTDEATLAGQTTQQNILSLSVLAPPPFSVQDIVGRTVQIFSTEISSSSTDIYTYNINVDRVLDSLDVRNIIRSYFTFSGLAISFIYEVQSSPQHVGLLGAFFWPGDPDSRVFTGHAQVNGNPFLGSGLSLWKKCPCTEIPLGISETHVQKIPFNSIYPAHLITSIPGEAPFDPRIGVLKLKSIVPLTVGTGGSATASVVISMRIDAMNPSGFAYKGP